MIAPPFHIEALIDLLEAEPSLNEINYTPAEEQNEGLFKSFVNMFTLQGVSFDSPFVTNFKKSAQVYGQEKASGCPQPVLQSGHGVCVRDMDGNNYIDFCLGGGYVTFGHGYEFDNSDQGALTLDSSLMTSSFATANELLCTSTLEASVGMKCLGYAQSIESSLSMVKTFFSEVVVYDLFSDDAKTIEDARALSASAQKKSQSFVINESVGTGRFVYPSIALKHKIPACGIIFGPGIANGCPFYPVCVSVKYTSAITSHKLEALAPFLLKPSAISEFMFATAIRSMEYYRKHCVVFNLQRIYKAFRSGLRSGIVAHKALDKICLDEQSGRILVKLINPSSKKEEYYFRRTIGAGLIGRGVYVDTNELAFSSCFSTKIEHVVRVTLAFKAALGDYFRSLA